MSGGDRNGKRCPRRAAKCVEYPTRPAIAAFIQSRGCTVPAYEYGLSRHFGSMRRPQASTTKDFLTRIPPVVRSSAYQRSQEVAMAANEKTFGRVESDMSVFMGEGRAQAVLPVLTPGQGSRDPHTRFPAGLEMRKPLDIAAIAGQVRELVEGFGVALDEHRQVIS